MVLPQKEEKSADIKSINEKGNQCGNFLPDDCSNERVEILQKKMGLKTEGLAQ